MSRFVAVVGRRRRGSSSLSRCSSAGPRSSLGGGCGCAAARWCSPSRTAPGAGDRRARRPADGARDVVGALHLRPRISSWLRSRGRGRGARRRLPALDAGPRRRDLTDLDDLHGRSRHRARFDDAVSAAAGRRQDPALDPHRRRRRPRPARTAARRRGERRATSSTSRGPSSRCCRRCSPRGLQPRPGRRASRGNRGDRARGRRRGAIRELLPQPDPLRRPALLRPARRVLRRPRAPRADRRAARRSRAAPPRRLAAGAPARRSRSRPPSPSSSSMPRET